MGFRYLDHSYMEAIHDPDSSAELVKFDIEELNKLKASLREADIKRVDHLILTYKTKTPPYWYWPEYSNPGTVIKQKMPRLWEIWHRFCESTHGALIGSLLFSDFPDEADINPAENPRKTHNAIVISSRLLLDISFARAQFEGVADDGEYRHVLGTYILPQQAKTT